MNTQRLQSTTFAALLAIATAAPIQAQEPPTKPTATPLKVTVTISRYQGDKRLSNLPYVLSINLPAGGSERANLRMGNKVPVFTPPPPQRGGTVEQPTVTYQDTGTSIDCNAYPADEAGRYRVIVTIDESSVYADDDNAKFAATNGRPTFRSFRTTDSIMLKDGQTVQMSNTPDRTTGETVRVDVALAVVK